MPGIQVEGEEVGNEYTQPEALDYYLRTLIGALAKKGIDTSILQYVAVNIGTTHGDVFTGIEMELMEQLTAVAARHGCFLVCHGTSKTPNRALARFPGRAGAAHIATDFATAKIRAIKEHAPEIFERYRQALIDAEIKAEKAQEGGWKETRWGKQDEVQMATGYQFSREFSASRELSKEEDDEYVIRWGRYMLQQVIDEENQYFADHSDIHTKVLTAVGEVVHRYAMLFQLDDTVTFYTKNKGLKTRVAMRKKEHRQIVEAYQDTTNANITDGKYGEDIIPTAEDIADHLLSAGVSPAPDRISGVLDGLERITSGSFPVRTGL